MLAEYFPILIFLVISVALGIILLVTGGILGPSAPDGEKNPLMNVASKPSKTRVQNLMSATTWSPFFSLSSISKLHFSYPGRWRSTSSGYSAW